MPSLYEIDDSILQMIEYGFHYDCVNQETGEIDEAKVQEYLNYLPVLRKDKLEQFGLLIKNLQAEINAIKAEEKTLAERRKSKEKFVDRLKENVTSSLIAFGEKKFETAKVVFSFRKSEVLEVQEGAKLPEEFSNVKVTIEPNKVALKAALKAGEVIDGVCLVEKQNLQIK